MNIIGHYINGRVVETSENFLDVDCPSTGAVESKLAMADRALVDEVITIAQRAQQDWRKTPPAKRAQIFAKFKVLVEDNAEKLCELIGKEHGKISHDAMGELIRGIENIEYAAGVPELLKGEPGINEFCERIFEFTEFIVNVLKIKLIDKGAPEKVALHTSCAARREMGVHITGRELLNQLDNVTLITHENESECCGFGGTFSVKHGDISGAMVADKSENLLKADVVRYVSADNGCMLNIDGALEYQKKDLRGQHIASYLLERTNETCNKSE